jgi:ABC-2 type transport system permease protein
MMASQLYWEKSSGNLPLYIIAPNSLMSILLGMAFGGLLATLLRAGAIIILGTLLFNIQFQVSGFVELIVVFTLTMAALYGLGMMLASIFLLFGREAWQIAEALREPVYFVSGFYFPVRALGFPVALAASVLPMTLGLDAMRQLSFGNGATLGFLTVGIEIAILAGLTVIFGVGAKVALEVVERKAIEEGTLTDRNR